MTFKLYAFVTLLIFSSSCKSDKRLENPVLKIILTKEKTSKLLNKYVYLKDVSKQKVLDSVLVKGDTILFRENWSPGFVPHKVSVNMTDTFQGRPYLRPMGIQSPYDTNFNYASFYVDNGETILKPFLKGYHNEQVYFWGSRQNEPYFKKVELQYTGGNEVERKAIIEENILKIKQYPYSFHLLQQLFYYKEKFLIEELKKQLAFFDSDVKKTAQFKSFSEYFANSKTYDKSFPIIEFENQYGKYQKIASDGEAYNLIVFWASWCGPCRKEIPDIKQLYDKFKSRGLVITSISIDGDMHNWHIALQQEKMPWQQLIAFDSTMTYMDLHFNIKTIPKAYLFNPKKELIEIFDDGALMVKRINNLFESIK